MSGISYSAAGSPAFTFTHKHSIVFLLKRHRLVFKLLRCTFFYYQISFKLVNAITCVPISDFISSGTSLPPTQLASDWVFSDICKMINLTVSVFSNIMPEQGYAGILASFGTVLFYFFKQVLTSVTLVSVAHFLWLLVELPHDY